jgi:hypothetical protein
MCVRASIGVLEGARHLALAEAGVCVSGRVISCRAFGPWGLMGAARTQPLRAENISPIWHPAGVLRSTPIVTRGYHRCAPRPAANGWHPVGVLDIEEETPRLRFGLVCVGLRV